MIIERLKSLPVLAGVSSTDSTDVSSTGRARQRRLIIDALLLGVVGALEHLHRDLALW